MPPRYRPSALSPPDAIAAEPALTPADPVVSPGIGGVGTTPRPVMSRGRIGEHRVDLARAREQAVRALAQLPRCLQIARDAVDRSGPGPQPQEVESQALQRSHDIAEPGLGGRARTAQILDERL